MQHRQRRELGLAGLWGQNPWDIMLQGGTLNGILGDPTQIDNLYQLGFARLAGNGLPYPTFGAYTGYIVALQHRRTRSGGAVRQQLP